jgi:hypothetical protein
MVLAFGILIEVAIVVMAVLASFWKPTLEVQGDDARLPIGIAINSWLAGDGSDSNRSERVGRLVKWCVVGVLVLGAAVWPFIAMGWIRA